ncbi:MAG TPA: DNRLRE domain-containing protein [Kofleriaceae bacterium]|nr:DNRLRE domain-containing protein [Kofleriaceae bacterium]
MDEVVERDGGEIDGQPRVDAGMPPDASCGMTGTLRTVLLGARMNGTGQASMIDTFLVDIKSGQNFGGAPMIGLCAACNASGYPWDMGNAVGLLRFELSAICPGSTITGATLFIDTNDDNLGSGTVGVYVVRQAWDEGDGSAAGNLGVANWNQRQPGVNWNNPGAGSPQSRDGTPFMVFAPTSTDQEYQLSVPIVVVQDWLNKPATNFGLALAIVNGSSDVEFHSRESPEVARRPGLSVSFTLP